MFYDRLEEKIEIKNYLENSKNIFNKIQIMQKQIHNLNNIQIEMLVLPALKVKKSNFCNTRIF